jgi:hypothetical protein
VKDEKARPQQEERAIWLWRHPDWTSWYAGVDCTRQQTIAAVRAMPAFVRKFGGTAPPPPPPPPPPPSTALDEAIAQLEATIAEGEEALAVLRNVLAYLRSLKS